ncbi:hypothetical protein HOY82DRAFT_647126 [Tuber indicum]|nr:hypothetical protein HOY82DRAFT_647126 [Tuber indicum]
MSRSLQMPATLIQAAHPSINRTTLPPTLSPSPTTSPSPQPITTDLTMHRTPQELRQLGNQRQPERLDRRRRTNGLIASLIAHNQPDTRTITPLSPEDPGQAAERSREPNDSAVTGDHVDRRGNIPALLASIKRSLYTLVIQNANISTRLQSLASSVPGYSGQRNCFLSTFKRDKLGCATPEDLRVIEAEGLLAYGGNVRLDATLYGDDGGITDIETMEKLYGILRDG